MRVNRGRFPSWKPCRRRGPHRSYPELRLLVSSDDVDGREGVKPSWQVCKTVRRTTDPSWALAAACASRIYGQTLRAFSKLSLLQPGKIRPGILSLRKPNEHASEAG